MNWIAIGDIHGKNDWKEIVNVEINNVDKIIFIGDYFDSWNISGIVEMENFMDILQLKKTYPDKVVLLTGNHDMHYLSSLEEKYSGYKPMFSFMIEHDCILPAINDRHLQMCCIIDNYLFSHAGITKTWCENIGIDPNNNLEEKINDLLYYTPFVFKFIYNNNSAYTDPHGNDVFQGPTWVRPKSLFKDKLDNYIQIVGHTEHPKIEFKNNVYLIDCLGKGYYLKNNDNTIQIKNINKY